MKNKFENLILLVISVYGIFIIGIIWLLILLKDIFPLLFGLGINNLGSNIEPIKIPTVQEFIPALVLIILGYVGHVFLKRLRK